MYLRVREKLLPHTFELLKHKHCKRNWRYGCDCEYCSKKREITHTLNVMAWNVDRWKWDSFAIFESKRVNFRRELRNLKKECVF